ncbi:MAG TPA: hypothetical protein DHV22_08030 [Xanthomarina gelatinilytica]|uniref:Lipoprotein n=1 Tax=Xanthomarina gelatinilytica TaxID=1137281 RepID=A0A3D6BQJ4_9FLAO|nr:hypothetical protein [Xanthomarina gelatinilytica]
MRLITLFIILLFAGCKTTKPTIVEKKVKETIIETVHDTIFEIKADSSYYKAYITCINNKPVISQPKARSGTKLKEPNVNLKDSTLTVDCEAEAQKLFAKWKSREIRNDTVIEIPVFIDKEFTFFQKVQLWLGRIFLAIILLATGFYLLKTYTKIGL